MLTNGCMCVCVCAGLFVYSSGCLVVSEDLATGKQSHFIGQSDVSQLAV